MSPMVSKHFFKTVILFIGIISLGLVGVFLVSHFDVANKELDAKNNLAQEPCEIVKATEPC
jgi:hypothetical protein